MRLSAIPAKDGLKRMLRLLANRAPSLRDNRTGTASSLSQITRTLAQTPIAQKALRLSHGKTPAPRPSLSARAIPLEDVLFIPTPDSSAEERASDEAIQQGQFLARQENWHQLEEKICNAESRNETTPAGVPLADLLAFGARADVVNAVDHALSSGLPLENRTHIDGIMALERVRLEMGRPPAISTLVALTHLDIGWACHRSAARKKVAQSSLLQARAAAHFARASKIMTQMDASQDNSLFVQTAQCALLCAPSCAATSPASDLPPSELNAVIDAFHALIQMAPQNPRHMRAFGAHLGTQDTTRLEVEARRVAASQQQAWGAAGYTWMYFDVLARNPAAREMIDVDFFVEGLSDIVDRNAGQDRINLLAAFCSIALAPQAGTADPADRLQAEMARVADWLIRDHLRELHPMIWAHACTGFDNDAQVRSARQFAETGRAAALRILAEVFQDEIHAGRRVVYTADGPEILAS